MHRWSWRGLRRVQVRTTLAATCVVAVTLAFAAAALVVVQRGDLVRGLAQLAEQQGRQVAGQIQEDGVGEVDPTQVTGALGDRALVQVVDAQGRIRAESPAIAGRGPLWTTRPAPGQVVTELVDRLPFEQDEQYVVVTTRSTPPTVPSQ